MMAPIPNETVLIDEAIAGDAEAFGQLYQHLHGAIYRYVYARVSNASDAEDLTSQVFLKAWEALPRYERREVRFASWLFRIAHNTTVDYLRARRHERYPLQLDDAEPEEQAPAALDQLLAAEEREHLSQAIAQLPDVQRRVIHARYFEERSYPEIAALVAKSLGACRVIQHRALSNLNQFLKSSLSIILLVALLFGGTLYAAEHALPGDAHYPVKRIIEQTRLVAVTDPSDVVRLRVRFAQQRLDEIDGLLASGRDADVGTALHDYIEQIESLHLALEEANPADQRFRLMLAGQSPALRSAYEQHLAALATIAPPEVAPLLTEARERTQSVYRLSADLLQEAPGTVPPQPVAPTAPRDPVQGSALPPTETPDATRTTTPTPDTAADTVIPVLPESPTAWPATSTVAPTVTSPPPPSSTPTPQPAPATTAPEPPPVATATATPTATLPPPAPATLTSTLTPEVVPLPTDTPAPPPTDTPAPPPTDTPAPPPASPTSTPAVPTDTPAPTMPAPAQPTSPQLLDTIVTQLLPPVLALQRSSSGALTFLIINGKPDQITAQLTVTLPAELDYVAASASHGGQYDPATRTLRWDTQTLTPASALTIVFSVTPQAGSALGTANVQAHITISGDTVVTRDLNVTVVILP